MEPIWITPQASWIATLLAALVAFSAARIRFLLQKSPRTALDILFLLPLALPSLFVINLKIHCPDLSVEDTLSTLPLFYLCALMGFRKVSRETVDAARLQGFGHCGIFWHVWFPTAWLWLVCGLALGLFRNALLLTILLYS